MFVQYVKSRPDDTVVQSSLNFTIAALNALKNKNPLTETFLVQLEVDTEGMPFKGTQGFTKKNNDAKASVVSVFNMIKIYADSTYSLLFLSLLVFRFLAIHVALFSWELPTSKMRLPPKKIRFRRGRHKWEPASTTPMPVPQAMRLCNNSPK